MLFKKKHGIKNATDVENRSREGRKLVTGCAVIRYFNFRKHLSREQRIVRDKRVKIDPSSYILHSTGEKMLNHIYIQRLSTNSRDKF